MKLRKILIALALILGVIALFHPQTTAALFNDATGEACKGVSLNNGGCSNGTATLNKLVTTVVNVISIVGGIIAVIMIMVAGVKYIGSGGDSSKVSSAKSTIIYSIIGLVVIALAQAIVRYVINTSTK